MRPDIILKVKNYIYFPKALVDFKKIFHLSYINKTQYLKLKINFYLR